MPSRRAATMVRVAAVVVLAFYVSCNTPPSTQPVPTSTPVPRPTGVAIPTARPTVASTPTPVPMPTKAPSPTPLPAQAGWGIIRINNLTLEGLVLSASGEGGTQQKLTSSSAFPVFVGNGVRV